MNRLLVFSGCLAIDTNVVDGPHGQIRRQPQLHPHILINQDSKIAGHLGIYGFIDPLTGSTDRHQQKLAEFPPDGTGNIKFANNGQNLFHSQETVTV